MATNPFLRFARGAATATATAPALSSHTTTAGVEESNARVSPPVGRKRKRTIKEEPEEEGAPHQVSASLVKQEAAAVPIPATHGGAQQPTTTLSLEGENARRIQLLEKLVEARRDGPDAAIDRFGTQACVHRPATTPAATQRFQILVAALLSSQTQDPITHAAMQRLHTHLRSDDDEEEGDDGLTIAKVRASSAERLEELLVPVGFYRRKAQQLKQVADTLHDAYKSDIPRTLDGLLGLPGVGPKIARVILLLAWDRVEEGLIVDTHVHRIAQRLHWVGDAGTKTPEQTRAAVDEWVPRAYWRDFSRLVVGFGQNVCVAVHPKCIECPLAPQCPSAFTYRHPGKQPKASTKKKKSEHTANAAELQYDNESDDPFETAPR